MAPQVAEVPAVRADGRGRQTAPFQHLRCDFLDAGVESAQDGLWMIDPEFLDPSGQPFIGGVPVPMEGTASMWILDPQMRCIHRGRISVGVRG
jgi:hypothetical protein